MERVSGNAAEEVIKYEMIRIGDLMKLLTCLSLSTNSNCRRQAAMERDTATQALEGKMALLRR